MPVIQIRSIQNEFVPVGFAQSVAGIVAVLRRAADQNPFTQFWPAPGPDGDHKPGQTDVQQLHGHFSDLRLYARVRGAESLLGNFETHLREVEAMLCAAVASPSLAVFGVDALVGAAEELSRRWGVYFDPLPEPPARMVCDEADRSLWLDDRCLGRELSRPGFGYVCMLARAYPDFVKWKVVQEKVPGCQGANQDRFKKQLPLPVQNLIESSNQGSALRLPAKLSTSVQSA